MLPRVPRFAELRLDELVSFTVPENTASRRVMEKLGMCHDPADDFDHPALPEGHPLRRHVLYRLATRLVAAHRGRHLVPSEDRAQWGSA